MAEKSDSVDKALKDAYYDIESSASLGTWQKLRDEVEKTVKNVDKEKVLDFLLRQPSYTIFKRRVENFLDGLLFENGHTKPLPVT